MTSKGLTLEDFSIAQLLAAIEAKKKSKLSDLLAKQAELNDALRRIDAELEALAGVGPRRGRPPKVATAVATTVAVDVAARQSDGNPASPKRRGRPPGRPGRTPGQEPSMGSKILALLAAAGSEAVAMTELTEKLKSHTTSDRPGIIVSQALIRLKKDQLVESAGRGLYRATAAGRERASRA